MNIAIICVTYNSNEALFRYLYSIEQAVTKCPNLELSVMIGDNGNENFIIDETHKYSFSIKIFQFDNVGYLGAAQRIVTKNISNEYDYTMITNVDIAVSPNFFIELSHLELTDRVGWVCPQIWSESEQRNRNPFIYKRNSKLKLNLLRVAYKYPFLHKFYTKTLYKRKKVGKILQPDTVRNIYAGHGSFIILTNSFMKKVGHDLNYPIFLYGEECYLAELCRLNSLDAIYIPNLIIYTTDHVSTGTMKSKVFYNSNYAALSYILKTFYN